EEGVSNIAQWFDLIFGYDSAQWDGSMDIFNEYKASIEEKISEELYLWLMYPMSVSENAIEESESLAIIEQEIISFISKEGKTSMVFILDKLDNFEDEDLIEAIFRLTDSNLVITNNSD
ncbi:MAG: hypothetical protein H7641_05140, partial [Candidatus Heimdallarchaeota archaeon]|nr:hypothetical protein [Candidatus Heimdallarchaeota archaeon]MCK4876946.1 hypothetical protein [Candidatus Heimdallarchaeota archaeon]